MSSRRLPHLRAALADETEAVIVAIGSSSTQGVAATESAHTYPALLHTMLTKALAGTYVAVINRSVGGQDSLEELARLDTDTTAIRPQPVIWQVGANGAMCNANPNEFKRLMQEGVARLRKAGIDVIPMDNQRSPKRLAAVEHIVLENDFRDVAQLTGVNLFSRTHLTDA